MNDSGLKILESRRAKSWIFSNRMFTGHLHYGFQAVVGTKVTSLRLFLAPEKVLVRDCDDSYSGERCVIRLSCLQKHGMQYTVQYIVSLQQRTKSKKVVLMPGCTVSTRVTISDNLGVGRTVVSPNGIMYCRGVCEWISDAI